MSTKKTKRITARVDLDDKALATWLSKQTNISASLRLLMMQASRVSSDDYVFYCASQMGLPVSNQAKAEPAPVFATETGSDLAITQAETAVAKVEQLADDHEVSAVSETINEPEILDRVGYVDYNEPEFVSQEPAPIVVPEPEQELNVGGSTSINNIEPEPEDDDGSSLTARLLADARRSRGGFGSSSGGNLGSSIEDMMISQSNQ